MYQKVDTNLNFVDREKQVEKFWKENHIFEKSMEDRKDDPTYMFYDGPPTANGKPHIGHVLTRVIKDMIPRYRTMKGYMVPRKAGWDTHGLPVELEVEKKLGLDGKEQIEEYGMEPFIQQCKESVWKYKGMWEDFSSTVGFWADMENPYVTYHDDYIESEWWALKEIWNKKLLYKGLRSFLTARVVVLRFLHRKFPRDIKQLKNVPQSFVLKLSEKMHTSWHGPQHRGHCRLTLHSA